MQGFHKIPHQISILDRKTYRKYVMKNKVTIASAFLEVLNDFFMKNQTSYNHYSKSWGWHRTIIKEFMNHIGFDIPTVKNQYHISCITLIKPKKSKKFDESILGIANKVFDKHFAKHNSKDLTSKDIINSNSYNNFCQTQQDNFAKHSDNNKIKELTYNTFKEIFSMYEKVNNILKKQGRGTSKSNIKYCFKIYLKKLKNIPINDLSKAVNNFLADKIVNTNHPIPMFCSLLYNFAEGKYDFESYLTMNDEELHKRVREYLAQLKNERINKKLSAADAAGLGSLS